MRLFVGLDINPVIRQHIAEFLRRMQKLAPQAKWVSPESLHVTLKFIGEQPPARLEEIKQALAEVEAAPLELAFRGCGFFPSSSAVRVFWVGVEPSGPIAALARSIDQVMTAFGLTAEKTYTPHLTLARERSPERRASRGSDLATLAPRLASAPIPEFGTMTALEFFLFESKLSPRGAEYTKLARFGLKQIG